MNKTWLAKMQLARGAMTYQEVASRSGLSKSSVESLMNGRFLNPSLETLRALANSLGYEVELKIKDRQ